MPKIQLYQFQKEAIEKFNQNNHQLLVSIPTGGGKTIVALNIIEKFLKNTNKKVLIVTPANLRDNFLDSFNKFNLTKEIQPIIIKNTAQLELNYKFKNCFIVSYNFLYNNINIFLEYNFDLLVIDELHYSRNDSTKNYDNIWKLRQHIPSVLGLTASPVMNKPEDFFNLISLILNDKDVRKLEKEYIHYDYIGKKTPSLFEKYILFKQPIEGVFSPVDIKNQESFKQKIADHIYLPHPDKIASTGKRPQPIYKQINITMSEYEKNAYKFVLGKLSEKTLKKLHNNNISDYEIQQIKNILISLQQVLLTPDYVKLGEQSHTPGSKIIYAAQHMKDSKEKSIVFTPFLKVGARVANDYFNKIGVESSLYSGDQSHDERKSIIDRFENDSLQTICLTTAGAEGLNLPSCKNIYFASLHFNPEMLEQIIGRALRITSTHETVNVYFLLSIMKTKVFGLFEKENETIDHWMMNIVKRKTVFRNNLFKLLYETIEDY